MNLGGGGCGEPRLGHCTPAWAIRAKLHVKKEKKKTAKNKETKQTNLDTLSFDMELRAYI